MLLCMFVYSDESPSVADGGGASTASAAAASRMSITAIFCVLHKRQYLVCILTKLLMNLRVYCELV